MLQLKKAKGILKEVAQEVEQHECSKSEILYEILYSKRLLIEHVEILEEALYDVEKNLAPKESNYVNPVATGIAVAVTGITSLISSRCLPLLLPAASYTAIYLAKSYRKYRGQRNKRRLLTLLKSVEEFENVIKKHILFFNELQRFKVGQVSDDHLFVGTVIQSLKDAILVFYDAIKDLETDYTIDRKYEIVYEQIEDLCQTDYFTKELDTFTAKNIKEFLKLFLYVQSQYLMRLGLIVAAGACEDKFIEFNALQLTPLIEEQISTCNYNFDIIMFVSNPEKPNYTFKKLKPKNELPEQLLRAKSYCMTFVPKLLAVAHQTARLQNHFERAMTEFDEHDKELDDFHDLIPFMSQLDAELLMCQEEFQRFHITYQKFLNMEPEVPALPAPTHDEPQGIRIEHDYKKVGETAFGHHDEFFALDASMDFEPEQHAAKAEPVEDEQLNARIVKRAFKPVLKQLKQTIEPLADAMKERERKVLKAKGIDVEENKLSDYEMSGSSSEEEHAFKPKRTSEKYNEMRELLQQKQQFNPFAMQAPPTKVVDEDVIE